MSRCWDDVRPLQVVQSSVMLNRLVLRRSHRSCPVYEGSDILVNVQEAHVDPKMAAHRLRKGRAILLYAQQWVKEVIDDDSTQAAVYSAVTDRNMSNLITTLEDSTARWNLYGDKLRPTAMFLDCFNALFLLLNDFQNTIKNLSRTSIRIANDKRETLKQEMKFIDGSLQEIMTIISTVPKHRSVQSDQCDHSELLHPLELMTSGEADVGDNISEVSDGSRQAWPETIDTASSPRPRSQLSGVLAGAASQSKLVVAKILAAQSSLTYDVTQNRSSLQARLQASSRKCTASYTTSNRIIRQQTSVSVLPITSLNSPQDTLRVPGPVKITSNSASKYDSAARIFRQEPQSLMSPVSPRTGVFGYDEIPLSRSPFSDSRRHGFARTDDRGLEEWEQLALNTRASTRCEVVSRPAKISRPLEKIAKLSVGSTSYSDMSTSLLHRRLTSAPRNPRFASHEKRESKLQDLEEADPEDALQSTYLTCGSLSISVPTPSPRSSTYSIQQDTPFPGYSTPITPSTWRTTDQYDLPALSSMEAEAYLGIGKKSMHTDHAGIPVGCIDLDVTRAYTAIELADALPGLKLIHDGLTWQIL